MYGLRKNKYEWLNENNIKSTEWQVLETTSENNFFVPRDVGKESEYHQYFDLTKAFFIFKNGLSTDRDDLFFDYDKEVLSKRIKLFFSKEYSREFKTRYRIVASSSYDIEARRGQTCFNHSNIVRTLYRPFDKRFLYYDPKLTSRPGWQVMRHLLHANLALLTCRQEARKGFRHILCTDTLAGRTAVSLETRESCSVFPVYLYPTSSNNSLFGDLYWPLGKDGRVPNLSREFVEEFAQSVKLKFVSDGVGDLKKTFGPEDVFHYIYAVFHSPEYRRRYSEFLKIDFPRVPMPKSKQLFSKLCNVGEELVKLHLLESLILEDEKKRPRFPVEGNSIVEKGYPKYVAHAERPQKGKVYINKGQYFEGVKPEVWEFHIGGYRVCEKWLKDRRQRELSYEDISHYEKIVIALGETIRLMNSIDEIIVAYGGLPIN